MKITVTTTSTKFGSLLSPADLLTINNFIAAQTPITVSFLNNESGETIYLETLSKTATTTEGRKITYQDKLALTLLNPLDTIYLRSTSGNSDVRVLVNALILTRE